MHIVYYRRRPHQIPVEVSEQRWLVGTVEGYHLRNEVRHYTAAVIW
jgi:hypothetical protein